MLLLTVAKAKLSPIKNTPTVCDVTDRELSFASSTAMKSNTHDDSSKLTESPYSRNHFNHQDNNHNILFSSNKFDKLLTNSSTIKRQRQSVSPPASLEAEKAVVDVLLAMQQSPSGSFLD
mmetsp:Transcript_796/g.1074  ORF Transcript_796/g.1074 Transcript_796/m.1074 type:complete len:120 (+) Transcript_796:600-959(+)